MMIKIGTFRIAPRPRFRIYDEEIIVNLRDDVAAGSAGCSSGDTCSGAVKSLELVFKMRFLGQGDCEISTHAYRELETYLNSICGSAPQEYYKRICTEEPLIYSVNRAYIRPLDIELEYGCEAIRTGEVHLFTSETNETTEIAMYGYTIVRPA